MEKRKIIFGTYDTAETGLWTLAAWELTTPELQTNYVDVPGRRGGPLDLSTALTDGEPMYSTRELEVVLESSEGTRLEREARINDMINKLDGYSMNIVLPDDSKHYLVGRVTVRKEYNDNAHARVEVAAVCEPWRYKTTESVITLTAGSAQAVMLENTGRMHVVPVVVVSGTDASVALTYSGYKWTLSAGAYQLPDLVVPPGGKALSYSGTGTVKITYREAVL